jgi:acetolactate synthase-1/3 small subunit
MMKQTISVLVENKAGVLNKITGLFARRAFNIESLAVGVTDDKTVSRITLVVDSGNSETAQVEKQLRKLIEVIGVQSIGEQVMVGRELMVIKVLADQKTRPDILNICEIMSAKIDELSETTMTLELSETPEKIDLFESILKPFTILEVVRTGIIAVQKGSSYFRI